MTFREKYGISYKRKDINDDCKRKKDIVFINDCNAIYDKKIQIHRLLKMYQLGVDLDTNQYVHHIDGNKLNAMLDNLEVVEATVHQSLHNKGKVLSKEHREKISLANKKRKGIKMKKRVEMTNLKELLSKGYSINKISKIYGCDWSTVKNRIHENKELLK